MILVDFVDDISFSLCDFADASVAVDLVDDSVFHYIAWLMI